MPLAALANRRASHSALRQAAARGRLQATRGADGLWRSTRNWVDDYLADRYSPRQAPPEVEGRQAGADGATLDDR